MFEKPQDGGKERGRVDENRQEEALSLRSKEKTDHVCIEKA